MYAKVCKSMPEYFRVCQSMPGYARVFPSFAKVVPKSSQDGSESESPMLLLRTDLKKWVVGGSVVGRDGYKSS